ncbi:MAG: glycosyltransferase family 39 protein [Elusimicrobiota bacterium]
MGAKSRGASARRVEAPAPAPATRLPVPVLSALFLAWLLVLAWQYRLKGVRLYPSAALDFARLLPAALAHMGGALALRLAGAAALWLLAAALGAGLLRLLRVKAPRAESLLLAAGLGMGLLPLLAFAAGLWSFRPELLRAATLGAAALALLSAPWWWKALPAESAPPVERPGALAQGAAAVTFAALLMGLLASLCPEIFYDSLVYHLALPKLWLLRGSIGATPHNIYSGLPLAGQTLYGLALALQDEKLASVLHWSFGLLTTAAVLLIGLRRLGAAAGAFAAFAFALCPAALYASWNAGVDLQSSLFCALSMLALLQGLERPEGERRGWALCAGFLAGSACGTKYNVLPVAGMLVLVHGWRARANGRGLRDTVFMALAAAGAFAPWLLKNMFFFGNPLYPFLAGVLGGRELIADPVAFLEASGSRDLVRTFTTTSGLKELLLQPWTTSVGTWPLGDWPGPVYILLLPLLLVVRPRRESERALLAAAVGGYLLWALSSRLVRYLLPAFPFLALCAALAVEHPSLPRWLRRVGWAAALYAGLFCLQAAYFQGGGIGQREYLTGMTPRAEYLKRQHPTYGLPYYAAAEFADRALPKDARVLVLGESRTYYLERDAVASTVFDHNPFWLAARESKDGADLLRRVRAMGVTHVLLSARQLLYRENSPGVFPREAVRSSAFAEFWARHLKPLFEEREDPGDNPRWLTVYEVVDAPNPDGAPTPNPALVLLKWLDSRASAVPGR